MQAAVHRRPLPPPQMRQAEARRVQPWCSHSPAMRSVRCSGILPGLTQLGCRVMDMASAQRLEWRLTCRMAQPCHTASHADQPGVFSQAQSCLRRCPSPVEASPLEKGRPALPCLIISCIF